MKLYTKEMFLIAAEKCEVSMIDAEHIMKYIDEYVTSIELPSNEDIEQFADESFETTIDDLYHVGIKHGAKWVIDKIKNQQ